MGLGQRLNGWEMGSQQVLAGVYEVSGEPDERCPQGFRFSGTCIPWVEVKMWKQQSNSRIVMPIPSRSVETTTCPNWVDGLDYHFDKTKTLH